MDTRTFDCVVVGAGTAGHLFDAPTSMTAEKTADLLRGRPAPPTF